MIRGKTIAKWAAGFLVIPLVVGTIAGVIIVRTEWFRNMVRDKIVAAVESSTGGKAEIGSFAFDWHHLRADIRDFVVHGTEGPNVAPLLRAKLIEVDLKLLSPFKGFVDIASLLIDSPQANVIVYPDGHTNIPAPKVDHPSDKTGLQTVVDLAIGRFELRNASVTFGDRKSEMSVAGQNLRAQLGYNPVSPRYTGEMDVSPILLQQANQAPLKVDVKLPVTLEKDKISIANAVFSTPQSKIVVVSGSMEHLVAPRMAAQVNAQVSLDEARRVAGLTIPLDTAHGPKMLIADVAVSEDEQSRIQVQNAHIVLGQSNIDASGTTNQVQFQASLALGEIGRLLRVEQRPEGTARIGGNATLGPNNDYRLTANVDARNVALQQGTTHLAGVSLDSSVTADPHRIALDGLRLNALGGGFAGSASIQEMKEFHVAGNLHNFDIEQLARTFMGQPLGYSGVISGPIQAQGNLQDTSALVAKANLGIAPGQHGVPVSGKLNVDYNARGDAITLGKSYVALPSTRVDLSGGVSPAAGQRILVHLVSRNLNDFKPVAATPVTLNNGTATVDATITGTLSDPRISAQAAVTNFSVDGRPFTRFSADLTASQRSAAVANGLVARGALQAAFSGSVGLLHWKPENNQLLRLDATVRNADLQDVLAVAGQSDVPATGALTADAHINGTVGSPRGTADLTVAKGTVEGEPFDNLSAHAVMNDRSIDIPSLKWTAGPSRLDANASFQHPVNDLSRGSLRAHVTSNQVQIAQFQSLVKDRPGLRGLLTLNADAAANMQPVANNTEFQLTSLTANVAARSIEMEGKNLGDLTATASSNGANIQYNVNSNFAGSTIHVTGQSLLAGNHQTTANGSISNLPIDRVLALAGRRDLPVNGTLSATAQVSGTLQDPNANAKLDITKGTAYQEPFDRLQATIGYSSQNIDLTNLRIDDGPSYVEMSGAFAHPRDNLQEGQVRFHVTSNDLQLARFRTLQQAEPGLGGVVRLAADGAATLHTNSAPLFSTLNANVAAKGLSVNQKPLGDLTATAQTQGSEVAFNLTSDLAHADIRGNGRMQLSGDYPVNAQVSFTNVTYSGLQPLLGGSAQPFDASLQGQITVSGPVSKTDALQGNLQLTKLEAHSVKASNGQPKPRVTLELHNDGPIAVALARSVVTIQSAHIVGPSTDLSLTGTASLASGQPMNLRANGNVKLEVLQALDPDIFSSGSITLNAAATGTLDKPIVNGRLQLQNASFQMLDLPNGLSNGNGVVQFNGTEAVIQSLSGEVGGGKLSATGFASYGGPEMQFRLQATADQVHIEATDSLTVAASAKVSLAGTSSRSMATGTVTIQDVAMHSHGDIGSMLASAATPPTSSSPSTGILAGMHLDVKIETAPNVQFHTTLTQNLQADASLMLRGTVDHPGMLGRVSVSSGEVIFFGNKYTVDQGTVSFFNPSKIDPILNVDLETSVQGVDVSITVSGPMDKMKLSYRSDPPMQFSDLVSLLASGKLNTTDPVLAARQPPAPQQSFQQMGASTVLGEAVANPVSGKLQRLFGVTKLKIDPQIIGTSTTPQATLTLQQQITKDLTFTYISDVTQSNPQILRIEWAVNPQWSAVAQRDVNGIFDLDFFYKKRFK
ncbi:MAG TPA: translocation/assembly module TamB domain-containing protein [Bryobacteraceae bacterium]|nr:translocation/assembly module TamB domain-containing protein [Bryobacteraceae bacterium]